MERPLTIRPIQPSDLSNGFFELLAQLTKAPPLSAEKFAAMIDQQRQSNMQQTVVVLNSDDNVMGTGSILIEPKFIRGGKSAAHIEDVVVDKSLRGANIGRKLIDYLLKFARDRGCYKVILNCADDNVGFYRKCGFQLHANQMAIYCTDESEK